MELRDRPLEVTYFLLLAAARPCRSSCWQLTKKSTQGKNLVMTSSVLERMCLMTSFPFREDRETLGMERDIVSSKGSIW